jgi:hypothetical protein
MHTVIGTFDDRDTAQRAVEKLVRSGIPRDDVQVQQAGPDERHTGVTQGEAMQDDGTGPGTQDRVQGIESEVALDRNVLSSIGHFFTSLFGKDHPSHYADTYSEAVRRGSSVVVVDVHGDEHAEHAATMLHELGAVDIDERSQQWRDEGWTGSELQAGDDDVQAGAVSRQLGSVRVVDRATQPRLSQIVPPREERSMREVEEARPFAAARGTAGATGEQGDVESGFIGSGGSASDRPR